MFLWVAQLFIRMVGRNCAYIGDCICRNENSGFCTTCFRRLKHPMVEQMFDNKCEHRVCDVCWAAGSLQYLRNVNGLGAKFATKCAPTLVCCNSVSYNFALAPAHCGVARCDDPRVFASLRAWMCVRVFASLVVGCSLARASASNPTFHNRSQRKTLETCKLTKTIGHWKDRSCALITTSPTMRATYASVAKCNAVRAVDPGIGAGSCWDFARNKKLNSGRKLNDPARASTTTFPTSGGLRNIIPNGPPNVARRAPPATPAPFKNKSKCL